MAKKSTIVWIDVESTGIDPHNGDKLLQVACRITNEELEFLDGDGFEMKVYYPLTEAQQMRDTAPDVVRSMHDATGLWDALPGGAPIQSVEEFLLRHIQKFVPQARTARLGGNSITLDRNFLAKYLPSVSNYLHYRSVDVTSVAGLVEMWMPTSKMYHKDSTHDAMDDITESVRELLHYRRLLFPAVGSESDSMDASLAI